MIEVFNVGSDNDAGVNMGNTEVEMGGNNKAVELEREGQR